MMRSWLLGIVLFVCLPVALLAAERQVPENPKAQKLYVTFNGETINAYYLLVDVRSVEERQADGKRGALAGNALVFFQGHAQRPADAFKFTGKLAMKSLSGVIIVPVCDTPYGKDAAWRGDQGKDVILMEIIRYVLGNQGIIIEGYKPLTSLPVLINDQPVVPPATGIKTKVESIGWSHGAILARRFAHFYPESVPGLAQVCPAGYEEWGAMHLLGRFSWEGLQIGTLMFRGYAGDTMGCSWGITKGVAGDFSRSCYDSAAGLQPSKLGRTYRDIKDCALYADDNNLAVPACKNIVVIFGKDDSCMAADNYGLKNYDTLSAAKAEAFCNKYYSGSVKNNAKLDIKVFPGHHTAPVNFSEQYADEVLKGLEQIRP